MKLKSIIPILFTPVVYLANAQQYSITDFGASTDSTVINTKAIQATIDACYKKGGGEVVVPNGKFYTGTILLKSNVYLHLMPGAVLQGSYNPDDYPKHDISSAKKFGTIIHNGLYIEYLKALVIADSAKNTGIVGEGAIKGAGEGSAFQLGENKDGKPIDVLFIGCSNLLFTGVKIFNSAQVTISISNCEKVKVDGIYVKSHANWNADGMDVDGRDITISNCVIDSEDDALCFKSEYLGKMCQNIVVTNCVLSSNCNGIKFGTGSRTGFNNISVTNCVVKRPSEDNFRHWSLQFPNIVLHDRTKTVNTGIVIGCVDGGTMENINISNIIMTDVLNPFTIRVGKRFVNPGGKAATMRNIYIQNITAESQSILPSVIAGLAESPIENLTLSNIHITSPGNVPLDSFKIFPTVIPEMEKSYPENRMFGNKLPASGFYVRHVKGLHFNDVSITYKNADVRPVFHFDDVNGIWLRNVWVNDKKFDTSATMLFKVNSRIESIVD